MNELALHSEFTDNQVVLSANNMKKIYLFGVPLTDPKTGAIIEDSVIESFVISATQEIQRNLGIQLTRTKKRETVSYNVEDFHNKFNPIKLTFPILSIESMKGSLGNTEVIKDIPKEWFTFSKRDYVNSRNMFLIVNGTSSIQFNTASIMNYFGYGNLMPMGIRRRNDTIPCFFEVTYWTGFCGAIPFDIIDVIGMLASIPLLNILGDVRDAGLSSKDLTIDGIRASYSTTSSATSSAYASRILDYTKKLDSKIKELKRHYESIVVESV
jgi:hypothetical protein